MITRLKHTPGVYLVGFMGCGKTTVGRLLAERLGWAFADLDDDIEGGRGTTISEIFATLGEPEFRRIESEALRARVRSIANGHPMVLALGGGAFVQDENYELVQSHGVSVWLDCPLERLAQRVACATHRPLARDPEKFAQLYHARLPFYSRADFRICVDEDDPAAAVKAVLALPTFR